jgi:hypothetical protein
MSKKSEYSVKSVGQGLASFTFVSLIFAIPIYAGYHLLKEKDESLQSKKQPSPLLVTGGAIAVWYLAWKLSGMEKG